MAQLEPSRLHYVTLGMRVEEVKVLMQRQRAGGQASAEYQERLTEWWNHPLARQPQPLFLEKTRYRGITAALRVPGGREILG